MLIFVVDRRLRRGHQVDVAVCVKHNRHARAKLEAGAKKVYHCVFHDGITMNSESGQYHIWDGLRGEECWGGRCVGGL